MVRKQLVHVTAPLNTAATALERPDQLWIPSKDGLARVIILFSSNRQDTRRILDRYRLAPRRANLGFSEEYTSNLDVVTGQLLRAKLPESHAADIGLFNRENSFIFIAIHDVNIMWKLNLHLQ